MATLDASKAGLFKINGDIEIHRLGFGAMRITGPRVWGPPLDMAEAIRTLRRLPELGIDFIDTANSYGPEVSDQLIRQTLYDSTGDIRKKAYDAYGQATEQVNNAVAKGREAMERGRDAFDSVSIRRRGRLLDGQGSDLSARPQAPVMRRHSRARQAQRDDLERAHGEGADPVTHLDAGVRFLEQVALAGGGDRAVAAQRDPGAFADRFVQAHDQVVGVVVGELDGVDLDPAPGEGDDRNGSFTQNQLCGLDTAKQRQA